MTTKVTFRVIFNRTNKLDRNGKAQVLIEAYQNGKRRYFKTGIRLTPNDWDKRKNEVKGNPTYNRIIRTKIDEFEAFETRFPVLNYRPFYLKDFDLFTDVDTPKPAIQPITLTAYMTQQIEREKPTVSYSAYIRYSRTVKHLTAYNSGKPVTFDSLTYSFIDEFDHYLRSVKRFHQNTIYKEHQTINKYLVKAIKSGIAESQKNPYNDFESKKEQTERVVLYQSEIERIEQLSFNEANAHLEFYKDAFLLAYYTLLRIGDLTSIRQTNLISTDKGLLLELKADKTGKMNRLPLYELHKTPDGPSKPERIIQKYLRTDKRPLFNRSHPILNKYLKSVFRLANITKDAHFHTARHSGITYLVQVLPTPLVQRLAQHSSIQTTMLYVHIANQMVEDALSEVQWYKS